MLDIGLDLAPECAVSDRIWHWSARCRIGFNVVLFGIMPDALLKACIMKINKVCMRLKPTNVKPCVTRACGLEQISHGFFKP